MQAKLNKLRLLASTLRHLKGPQALRFLVNRSLGFRSVAGFGDSEPVDLVNYQSSLSLNIPTYSKCFSLVTEPRDSCCQNNQAKNGKNESVKAELVFLNTALRFDVGDLSQFNWQPQQFNRLWGYNLHYFAYLREDVPEHCKQALLQSWLQQNAQGTQPAWEPYTASLRIVNWVLYLLQNSLSSSQSTLLDKQLLTRLNISLFEQCRWLRANLERHILANHYFENLKALVFVCAYFDELKGALKSEIERTMVFALKELEQQLQEQFLDDGGHYERTPSYHLLLINDCLELLALLQALLTKKSPAEAKPSQLQSQTLKSDLNKKISSLVAQLQTVIEKGVKLAADIASPQLMPPLFNDSAFDSSPPLDFLYERALALGLPIGTQLQLSLDSVELPAHVINYPNFGIMGWRGKKDWCVVKTGQIGPNYQPGHTHCDLLSYELMLQDKPLVVDSGVYEYQPGPMRKALRATSAHNTVSIGGDEQSEVWGEFRVGRRAKLKHSEISRSQNIIRIDAEISGFYGLGGAVHQRSLALQLNSDDAAIKSLDIQDSISRLGTTKKSKVKVLSLSYIHLHPDIECIDDGERHYVLQYQGCAFAALEVMAAEEVSLGQSWYSPVFGRKYPRTVVQISFTEACHYRIQVLK